MKYQDPLDPLKNEEFVAQMAQFSSLEQLINLNTTMGDMKLLETSINNSQAVNLIGKNITVFGNTVQIQGGNASDVHYVLADEASEVTITVYDSAGAVVRSITIPGQSAGKQEFEFDGLDDQGNTLSDGNYTFKVDATDINGDPVETTTFSNVHVDAITFENGYVFLLSGTARFMLSDVIEVRSE
jgi:flagellar basal-body rod modification protein FlgD